MCCFDCCVVVRCSTKERPLAKQFINYIINIDAPFTGDFDALGDGSFDKLTSGNGDLGGLHFTWS